MRRVWLQIHLSTLIAAMFGGGGVLWANLRPKHFDDFELNPAYIFERFDYGWPFVAYSFGRPYGMDGKSYEEVFWWMATLDAAIAIALIGSMCLICESLWKQRRTDA